MTLTIVVTIRVFLNLIGHHQSLVVFTRKLCVSVQTLHLIGHHQSLVVFTRKLCVSVQTLLPTIQYCKRLTRGRRGWVRD